MTRDEVIKALDGMPRRDRPDRDVLKNRRERTFCVVPAFRWDDPEIDC